MLRELRLLRQTYPEITHETIVTLATWNGAAAIGDSENRGSLDVGKWADMIGVPVIDDDPYTSLLDAEVVAMTMVQGEIVP